MMPGNSIFYMKIVVISSTTMKLEKLKKKTEEFLKILGCLNMRHNSMMRCVMDRLENNENDDFHFFCKPQNCQTSVCGRRCHKPCINPYIVSAIVSLKFHCAVLRFLCMSLHREDISLCNCNVCFTNDSMTVQDDSC